MTELKETGREMKEKRVGRVKIDGRRKGEERGKERSRWEARR